MATDDEAYQELAAYTLGLHDAAFIHQHIVDAHAVHAAMPTVSFLSASLAFARPSAM
jgi:hypothetical protein